MIWLYLTGYIIYLEEQCCRYFQLNSDIFLPILATDIIIHIDSSKDILIIK